MLRFLFRRLIWLAITLLVVMSVSFFLMKNVPGGPFDGERKLDAQIEANIQKKYHLDWPLWRQSGPSARCGLIRGRSDVSHECPSRPCTTRSRSDEH